MISAFWVGLQAYEAEGQEIGCGSIINRYGYHFCDYISSISGMTKTLTGDLHDGAGLSDATEPNGVVSNKVFENADYDLLAIGVP